MEIVVAHPDNADQNVAAVVAAANLAADAVLGTAANPITQAQLAQNTTADARQHLHIGLEAHSDALDELDDTPEVVAATTRVQTALERLEAIDP
ncbi:hypothetical protein DFR70_11986 [Nocardia tenerifensis]|uniref:Uncharacterized protein n=1 Tax=Nocardia tenerifensis TaxID=228006 RepID=A0A318KD78_9NOCA|nr:hypothetical protein [Nocardia tenerifensis]PXX56534.1 hypothetical protein DFR70_11986 [Nocardia tenerifensis]